MKNTKLARLRVETLEDAIAISLKSGVKIRTASFEQWSDRNRITPGLRGQWLSKTGKPLDFIAHNVIKADNQFSGYDEQDVIERVVAFVSEYDTRAKFDAYVSRRLKEQASEAKYRKAGKTTLKPQDVECLTNHALEVMSRDELRDETRNFLKSPSAYFGRLLDVEACRVDLFTLPEAKQVEVVKQMHARAGAMTRNFQPGEITALRSKPAAKKPLLAMAKNAANVARKTNAAKKQTTVSNTPKSVDSMKTKSTKPRKSGKGSASSSARKLVKRLKGEKVTPKKKKETFLQKMKRAEKVHKASFTGKYKEVPVYGISMAKAKRQVLAGK